MTTQLEIANVEVAILREREAAMREILQVISASRTDPAPVFDTILTNAARLSSAPLANLCLLNDMRSHWNLVAHYGEGLRHLTVGKTDRPLHSELVPAVSMRTASIVHVEDLVETDLYRQGDPGRVAMVEVEGMRTILCVPLVLEGKAIGCITLFRREVRAFTNDEIGLMETFAAQAVIAIENGRQFREVQKRLERETATSDVLSVISRSRDDDQRVFDTLLQNAVSLSGSAYGSVWLVDKEGTWLESVARNDTQEAQVAGFDRRRMDATDSAVVACVRECAVWRMEDLQAQAGFDDPDFPNREWMTRSGARSMLLVPLVSAETGIGLLAMYRNEVRPYSDDDVGLIEGFAAQAVIAIENTRQFKALEALNAELGQRVKKQVGEIERMGRLKRFLPAAVADAVVSSGSEEMLRSHRALLGVLFCDIRGFTAFCETAEPEETIEVLQTYHEEMGKLINAHGAGVDHRMGDGIMVLFNDPLPCEDPAGDAVRLAVAMRAKMAELSRQWKRLGHKLGFGVGVSLGYATVGMVGYEDRSDYTASGTAINVSSRLCEMAKDGEILLSSRAAIAVEDEFPSVSAGEVTLKGIREPVEVFRVIDGTAE